MQRRHVLAPAAAGLAAAVAARARDEAGGRPDRPVKLGRAIRNHGNRADS